MTESDKKKLSKHLFDAIEKVEADDRCNSFQTCEAIALMANQLITLYSVGKRFEDDED